MPCHALTAQDKCIEGFGKYTGIGAHYFRGFVCALESTRSFDVRYVRTRALPGIARLARWWTFRSGLPHVSQRMARVIIATRELARSNPRGFTWRTDHVNVYLARCMDTAVWPLVSLVMQPLGLVSLVAVLAALMLLVFKLL